MRGYPFLVLTRCVCLLGAFHGIDASAQTTPPSINGPDLMAPSAPTPAERAWDALQYKEKALSRPIQDGSGKVAPGDTNHQAVLLELADGSRAFYQSNPTHAKAGEARKLEIFSLIRMNEEGDTGVEERLTQAVNAALADAAVAESMRAKIAAARAFTKETRGIRNQPENRETIERVARQLVKDYPTQPQGYEALLALSKVSDSRKSLSLADEIIGSSAPVELKKVAQLIRDREALVGRALSEVIGTSAGKLLAVMNPGNPLIVYSWATWAPGSIELGRMIQARRFDALGICLDEAIETARQVQHASNLGGVQVFDEKGTVGDLATSLKLSATGQVYLVDGKGIIRDVRGGENLEAKLIKYDFRTPTIVPPEAYNPSQK